MQLNHTNNTLVFLHGFLGSPSDWDPITSLLKDSYHCLSLDLYPLYPKKDILTFESFPNVIIDHLKNQNITSFHLIGYSMGGRLAMAISQKIKPLSLTIISSHFGLQKKEEKEKRHKTNILWANRLDKLSFSDFLQMWYDQPIFAKSDKEMLVLNRLKHQSNMPILKRMLLELSLGKQPYYFNKAFSNALFIYGEKDTKYKNLYENHIPDTMRTEIPEAFHMPHITHPTKIAELLLGIQLQKKNKANI